MTEGLAAAAGVPFRGFSRPPPRFRDKPFKYLQELEGRVESLTNLGDGVLRVDGWVVLVPLVAPGERVRVAIHSTYKNHSEATLLEVLERSLDRVEPECPLYGACGGCQYQHLSLEAQRRWKRQQVIDCLERIGGLKGVVVQPTAGTKHAYGYRSKITPHFDRPSPDGTVHAIGFRRTKFPSPFYGEQVATASAGIIDVPRCEIARPAINDALPAVRTAALEAMRRRARGVAAAFGGGGGSGSSNGGAENVTPAATTAQKLMGATLLLREVEEGVVTDHNAQVMQRVGELSFSFRAGEFFQNNPHILPRMVKYVTEQARCGGARFLIDAYCGGGIFCLSAAASFERCAGIEISAAAVACATANAAANNIANCIFWAGSAEAIFQRVEFSAANTAIIVDPPRKGCGPDFLQQLVAFGPRTVVYVSCDPSTQARDAKAIVAAGYVVEDVLPFDLFPHTRHIENVMTFSREHGTAPTGIQLD